MLLSIGIPFFDEIGIDLKRAIFIALVVILTIVLVRFTRWGLNKFIRSTSAKLKVDPTRYRFFRNAVSFVIWILAMAIIIFTIPKLRTLALTLFAGAGVLLAIIGFAAQQAFSNIIGGVFIVIFRPFRVGDLIKVGTLHYGIVEDITLRHTVINNFENKRIIIPNAAVNSETIINDSIREAKICCFIEFGISYDADLDKAVKIIQEESMKDKRCIDNRTQNEKKEGAPVVLVRLTSFGEYSVMLRAFVWTTDSMTGYALRSDINFAVKARFDKEGIEIPFPYRTIVYKSDLDKKKKKD